MIELHRLIEMQHAFPANSFLECQEGIEMMMQEAMVRLHSSPQVCLFRQQNYIKNQSQVIATG